MQNALLEWLESGDPAPLKIDKEHRVVVRIPVDQNFDYLFCQWNYNRNKVQRSNKFEYTGIYCKKDKKLYDLQHRLSEFDDKYMELRAETLREQMQGLVQRLIEETINNDRKNLKVKEINDSQRLKNLEYYIQYQAYKDARELYLKLDGETAEAYRYKNQFRADAWSEETLLDYILDPMLYVTMVAAMYVENNQENILSDFLRGDALLAEYAKILATPENNIHTILKIRKGISTVSAKQVTITMMVGEKELTFKYDAARLTWDCENKFSSYGADRDGRDQLEEAMGRGCNDFCPKSIVRITYGRNTIYEA